MAKIAFTGQAKNGGGRQANQNRVLDETAETQRLAYQFFVERGYEHGHDQEDWLRAENTVRSRRRI